MTRTARPSQRMIAELANVSQAAVSMVVRGDADANRIPKATQERIEQVMREVGYVPNVAARLLRSGRNGLVGVHTYEPVFPVRDDDYYHDFLLGIEAAAVDRGVDLVLFTSTLREDGSTSVYSDGMNRLRLADGAIFFGLQKNEEDLQQLVADGYPFVFIGKRRIGATDVPYVTADYAQGIRSTLDAVKAAGHRHVAYLAGLRCERPQEERRSAFESASKGLVADLVTMEPAAVDDGLDALLGTGTTALLLETVEQGEALAAAVARRGIRVPADLSVVVLDSASPKHEASGWSHMAIPRVEMGRASLDLLLDRLDGASDDSVVLPIDAPWTTTIAPPTDGPPAAS